MKLLQLLTPYTAITYILFVLAVSAYIESYVSHNSYIEVQYLLRRLYVYDLL